MSETTLPWSQQENEPDRWFHRFELHAKPLGYEYSIKSAYWAFLTANVQEREKDAFDIWKDMAVKYNWKDRATAWADFEKERIQRRWQQRRIELLDQDWDSGFELRRTAGKLLEKFEDLQEVSVMEEEDPETGNVTRTIVLKPNFTIGDVARMAKIGSELQRLGVGEPTSISSTAVQAGVGVYLPAIGSVANGGKPDGQGEGRPTEDTAEATGAESEIRDPGDNANSDD